MNEDIGQVIDVFIDKEGQAVYPYNADYALVCCAYNKSDNSWLDRYKGRLGTDIPFINPLNGESLFGLVARKYSYTLFYAKLDRVTMLTPKTMATVGANVSGNFRCGISIYNHYDCYSIHDNVIDTKFDWQINDKLWDYLDNLELSRISQFHHLFISVKELKKLYEHIIHNKQIDENNNRERLAATKMVIANASKLGYDNKATMCTFIAYLMVSPLLGVRHLVYMILASDNKNDFNNRLKQEGILAKQLQTVFRDDLSVIYETNVLINRVYDTVDWKEEKEKREKPVVVNISSSRVYSHSKSIFEHALGEGKKPRKVEWRDYWDTRWAHTPCGSAVSQYASDIELRKKFEHEYRNKSNWIAALDDPRHDFWTSRHPSIYASTSIKYEWGKTRALYGCDVTSFVNADYGFSDCENVLPSYFPVGEASNIKNVERVLNSFKNSVPFCYDFEDFNSQHSNSAMVNVLLAWRDTFKDHITKEQLESVNWTIKSIDDVSVSCTQTHERYKCNGTLMSGWRLTSLINTVLNRVYLLEAGIQENVIYSVHNGDDMYAGVATFKNALNVIAGTKKHNIRAQLTKMNIGTIGEFLRIDARAKTQTSAQYLTRAVATATHGRVETGNATDFIASIEANSTRMDEMGERGAIKANVDILNKNIEKYICKVFGADEEVTTAFTQLHRVQGGASEEAPVTRKRIVMQPVEADTSVDKVLDLIQPGLNNYTDFIRRKLEIGSNEGNAEHIFSYAKMRETVRGNLSVKGRKYVIEQEKDPYVGVYRGMYKAWEGSKFISQISRGRMLGFSMLLMANKLDRNTINTLHKVKDINRFLNAVT